MADRKPFLLRIDPELFTALTRWADDETRSLNGQIEFLLRRTLEAEGRLSTPVSTRRSGVRAPKRLSKPVSSKPSGDRAPRRLPDSVSSEAPATRPAAPKPASKSPPARIPVDSWDAMED
jgi:hypothetical protein